MRYRVLRPPLLGRTSPIMLLTLTLLMALVSTAHATATFDASSTFDVNVSGPEPDEFSVTITLQDTALGSFVSTGAGATLFRSASSNSTDLSVTALAVGQTGAPPSEASASSVSATLEFDIVNEDEEPIEVTIGFSGLGACQADVNDPASEFASCSFNWLATVGGTSLSNVSFQVFTSPGDPSVFLSALTTGLPDFNIPEGETLSVHLFVEVSGQAIARAAVPVPATGALLAIGLAGLGAWRWRGRRR